MKINKVQENGKLNLYLEGWLDATTAPQLQSALLQSFDEAASVCLDFAKLDYVSSAGIRVLLVGHRESKARKKALVLSNISADVMKLLDMTRLSDKLTIV